MDRVTLADVAKIAQVSTATVSRVIADSPLISIDTKEKVQKIIDEMNYIPNSTAQSLTKNSTKIIGVVLNSHDIDPLSNNFFSEVLSCISDCLIQNKYYTLYIHANNEKEEKEYIKFLVGSRRVDGLIFLRAYNDESILEYLYNLNVPFSIIGTPNNTDKYIWVDNDNVKATYTMTKNLIDQGRENICFLGGPKDLKVTNYRYIGYKKALNEKSIKKEYVLESLFDVDRAYELIKKFLKENIQIEAIVTTDDILAIASLKACKDLKKEDIKVTGFNNTYIRRFSNYKFSTVEINVDKLGKTACELLISKIENQKMNNNHAVIEAYIIEEGK